MAGSRSPATKASNIRRPLVPHTSETTVAGVTLVSSRSWYTRLLACVRVWTRATRVRVRLRQAQMDDSGIKLNLISP